MAEADLVVRVASGAINTAGNRAQALAALDQVYPCIELVDLVYDADVRPDASALLAVNVGARRLVLGPPIDLTTGADWERRLGEFEAEMRDEGDRITARGNGRDLLGHPLNVVLWLRDSLAAEGRKLRPGDLLSLGTLTALQPVFPGSALRARYLNLDPDGPAEVAVSFSPGTAATRAQ